MRAAAVALVLIVGAAVVLWFGNMLNSWVLGGLMGGLAALLLSIPISLTLFSFLSRRHDERLKAAAEEQEEISLARSYDYDYEYEDAEVEEIPLDEYEYEDEYELPRQRERYEDADGRRAARNLPAPIYPRLPAAGQSQASARVVSTSNQRPITPASPSRQQPKAPSVVRGKNVPSQRLSPDPRSYYPGKPAYRGDMSRSLHQSAALHAARQEAAKQQDEDDVEVLPTTTHSLKRLRPTRPTAKLVEEQAVRPKERRTSRQLGQQTAQQPPYQNRHRRKDVDATPGYSGTGTGHQVSEPRTEPMHRNARHPQTGPVRREVQTGQVVRHPQLDEEYFDPNVSTGTLKKPLVRRAPYTYEDDSFRQELAQQLDPPVVRRSSRYEDEEGSA